MQANIRFLKGKLQGHKYKISAGATIGRKGADVNLPDPKVSSRHGQFLIEGDQFVLVDIGSRNGFVVNGKKLKKVNLFNGLIIQIGDTVFMIEDFRKYEDGGQLEIDLNDSISKSLELDLEGLLSNKSNSSPESKNSVYSSQYEQMEIQKYESKEAYSDDWSGYFIEFSKKSLRNISNMDLQIVPFKRPVVLTVKKGTQLNTKWTLGYGPRFAGRSSFDIPIEELKAPDICFSLVPSNEGVLFKTKFPSSVLLNNKSVKSDILKEGDVITIFGTELSIGLLDD